MYMGLHPCVLPVVTTFAALAMVPLCSSTVDIAEGNNSNCLSWRTAVETGNLGAWATVPPQCVVHVEAYMLGGQYRRDVRMVVDLVHDYVKGILPLGGDGRDAWVIDVDDTCLSNLHYYRGKRFGGEPYDRAKFKVWAKGGVCVAIPEMLDLFRHLVKKGFKVFLLTGRDEETLVMSTMENLLSQGFVGYEGLFMRRAEHRGRSSLFFKTEMRKKLVKAGYRIRGNIGDQWSDLCGDCPGDRSFKLPNPMYFVP